MGYIMEPGQKEVTMSVLSPWFGGTRRLVGHVGQSGLLFGPIRRAIVEPAAAAHDEALRLLLCYHGKRAWQAGLIAGCCGNLSARLHNKDAIYITPRGADKSRLHASDIRVVGLFTAPELNADASVELPLHRACYLADVRIGAVIHTHAPALTALGIRDLDLVSILPEAARGVQRAGRLGKRRGRRWREAHPSRATRRGHRGTHDRGSLRADGVRRAQRKGGVNGSGRA
jgi:hypothetical protein